MLTSDRRGSRRALLPLALMALMFLVPSFRSCSDQPAESPAHYAAGDVGSAVWIAPVFLAAGLLAFLTARALRKKELDLTTRRLGLFAVSGVAVTTFGAAAVELWPFEGAKPLWLLALVAVFAGAFALLRRARGGPPWRIWERVLGAFAVTSLVSAPTLVFGGELLFGNVALLGPGAYVFLGAQVVLLAVCAAAALRRPGSA